MPEKMQRVVLAARPKGQPDLTNFRLETGDIPQPGPGEVLVEVKYLSLDPYMRGRMDAAKSYAKPVAIGATMEGEAVGEVIASESPDFKPGDFAMGLFGWASHGVLPAAQLRKIDPEVAPIQTSLGVLGMPGLTGWFGLQEHGRPKEGETLVVGAATGAVGSMVGQIGKALGLRVVGVAGGAEKCAYASDVLGFDACLDHRAAPDADALNAQLAAQCPDGVDIYFDSVGAKTLEAVLPLMNPYGRIPVCGVIGWYSLAGAGPEAFADIMPLPRVWRTILVNKLSVNGFIIMDHYDRYPEFLAEVGPMVRDGRVIWREDVSDGLESAPQAFLSMLGGGNFGKQLVRVS
ncbi:MAG: NADP-dependent oxidoreductase [Paracoccaceae bacterium]